MRNVEGMGLPMKNLFLSEFDTPVHLTINRVGSDKNATADNAEKNAAETAEKEKHRLQ